MDDVRTAVAIKLLDQRFDHDEPPPWHTMTPGAQQLWLRMADDVLSVIPGYGTPAADR